RQAAAERVSMWLYAVTVEACSHIDGSAPPTGLLDLLLGRWRAGSGYATIGVSRDRCPFAYVGRQ
ncbi:MAG: hypothetical protein ACREIE_03700, partial [Nitrospiraceae bacterium]